jgi:uncharacterized protein YcbK (DUF882 family)
MKFENGYIYWTKKSDESGYIVQKHFSLKEFECQCNLSSCTTQIMSEALLERLGAIREELNKPLKITSAYRCSAHQEEIRKSGVSTVVAKKSQHELGNAVDIQCNQVPMEKLLEISEKYFKSIGLAKTFYHVDMRDDKVRRWKY